MERDWIVAQLEARQHYAIPRALHARGRLKRLYTDAWCSWGHSLIRKAPEPIASFANRFHPDLPSEKVQSYTVHAMWHRLRQRVMYSNADADRYQHYMDVGADFATRIRDDLQKHSGDWGRKVFFSFDTGCLEVLEFLRGTQCITIVDQMDAARVEKSIVLEEMTRWPDWAEEVPVIYEPYEKRRAAEWELANAVIVNSDWTKQALVKLGVDAQKIYIVPQAYEPASIGAPVSRTRSGDALRVLWLGKVILRKGIQYLMEAARVLENEPVEFTVVGPIGITEEAVNSAPDNVTFKGQVLRHETSDYYRSADVFVLPTLSDGFAITQLEAMAHGLPVIATPNCGKVVTPEEDGFIVPPRDSDALAEAVVKLADDRSMLANMARRAREKAQTFTLERFANGLLNVAAEVA